jgi:hypothetical protein
VLTSLAGYMVVADGKIKSGIGMATPDWQSKSIDWALGPNAKKYGNIDSNAVAASGQSCGGLTSVSLLDMWREMEG